MMARDPEQLANEAGRGPVRHGNAAARPADPDELVGDDVGTGCEHRAEHGDHQVKRAISIGEVFGIALVEPDGKSMLSARLFNALN